MNPYHVKTELELNREYIWEVFYAWQIKVAKNKDIDKCIELASFEADRYVKAIQDGKYELAHEFLSEAKKKESEYCAYVL